VEAHSLCISRRWGQSNTEFSPPSSLLHPSPSFHPSLIPSLPPPFVSFRSFLPPSPMETLVGASGQKKKISTSRLPALLQKHWFRSHTVSTCSAINYRKVKQHKLSWSLCTLYQGCRWAYTTHSGCGVPNCMYNEGSLHFSALSVCNCVHVCDDV